MKRDLVGSLFMLLLQQFREPAWSKQRKLFAQAQWTEQRNSRVRPIWGKGIFTTWIFTQFEPEQKINPKVWSLHEYKCVLDPHVLPPGLLCTPQAFQHPLVQARLCADREATECGQEEGKSWHVQKDVISLALMEFRIPGETKSHIITPPKYNFTTNANPDLQNQCFVFSL